MGVFRNNASFGKRNEYAVIAELMKRNFDVYQTLVDDQGIDCVIRVDSTKYLDIQIKASSKTATQGRNFGGLNVDLRDNYYFIFYVEEQDEFYIIPSVDFKKLWRKTTKEGKHKGKYNVVIRKKGFEQYKDFEILRR